MFGLIHWFGVHCLVDIWFKPYSEMVLVSIMGSNLSYYRGICIKNWGKQKKAPVLTDANNDKPNTD